MLHIQGGREIVLYTGLVGLVLVNREGGRNLDRIAYLPAIPTALAFILLMALPVLAGKVADIVSENDQFFVVLDNGSSFILDLLHTVQVHDDNILGLLKPQLRIVQREVNAGFEGLIQCSHPISCEK